MQTSAAQLAVQAWKNSVEKLPVQQRLQDAEVELVYYTGYQLLKAKKYQDALNCLRVTIFYRPTNTKYLMTIGLCHKHLQNFPEAIRNFSLVGLLKPGDQNAVFQVAQCQILQGRLEEAAGLLETIVVCAQEEKNPQDLQLAAQARGLIDLIQQKSERLH